MGTMVMSDSLGDAFFGKTRRAILSLLLLREKPQAMFWISLPFMLLGAWLMLTESHQHEHTHELLEHAHAHDHSDVHHTHEHPTGEPQTNGSHAHVHHHPGLAHAHPHTPDLHHRHAHEKAS